MAEEEHRSFWYRLLKGGFENEREQRVLEYMVHRINDGAYLEDIVQEEYVRRNLPQHRIEAICADPRMVEAAREAMQEAFEEGSIGLQQSPR